jgi:hypothetical protein
MAAETHPSSTGSARAFAARLGRRSPLGFLELPQIAIGGYCLGLILGVGGASGKLYGGPVTRDLLACYTTVVRAVPELVLIVLLYYAGTDAINALLRLAGLGTVDISGLTAGILVIGIVQAPIRRRFCVVRSGGCRSGRSRLPAPMACRLGR